MRNTRFFFGVGLDAGLAHLQAHESARERYAAYVVAGSCLHSHHIADFKGQTGTVHVKALAGVLELHLYHIVVGIAAGNILEIVEAMELRADVAPSAGAAAAGLRATAATAAA